MASYQTDFGIVEGDAPTRMTVGSFDMPLSFGEDPSVFEWRDMEAGSWRINAGPSKFLVASGSGWSRQFGLALYEAMKNGR